ncbi:unnamed protein product [Amoebophrya sp. A25]|nr:unnamed protein product [Amoebophrya sp. A25]|eukprot:GSA25T00024241001.1
MASFEYQHSILYKGENPATAAFVPKNRAKQAAKVVRHRPGLEPSFYRKDAEDQARKQQEEDRRKRQQERDDRKYRGISRWGPSKTEAKKVFGGVAQTRVAVVAQKQIGDSLAERIAKRQQIAQEGAIELSSSDDDNDLAAGVPLSKPLVRPGQQAAAEESEDISESDESSVDEGDAQKRQIALQRAKAIAQQGGSASSTAYSGGALVPAITTGGGGAQVLDDSDSDDESSSDRENPGALLAKPVFVRKGHRALDRERAAQAAAEQEALQQQKIIKRQKKEEAKLQVATIVAEEEQQAANASKVVHSESEYSLDSEEDDTAEALEEWKVRELERVLHLQKLRTQRIEEFEHLERRRNMTEQERQEDDERLDKLEPETVKSVKYTHMQKYYHQGGYFQDKAQDGSEALYRRDVNQPLASEKFDKQLLPKSMQVRRGQFGVKGNVKHNSLKEADTTDFSSAWIDEAQKAKREKYMAVMQDQERQRQEKLNEMNKMGQR